MECTTTQKKLCYNDSCDKCYNRSFASHEKSKFWCNENQDYPRRVYKSSKKKYWFYCNICNHKFDASPLNVVYGCWCPYCSSALKKLCEKEECKFCFERSFASHPKSKYWNKRNEMSPRQVPKSSAKKYWFNCYECGHDFESRLDAVVRGSWCLYCASKALCENSICDYCFNKSFASYGKAKYWSNLNKLTPRQVPKRSHSKYWFNCDKCDHEFESPPHNVSVGAWCPYCSNQELCKDNNCVDCFSKSFASTERVKYWSFKNIMSPRQVYKGSGAKYWFDCDKCDSDFESVVGSITNGVWCPYCVHKTEEKLFKYLSKTFSHVKRRFKTSWCKNIKTNCYLPFDIVIENLKIIIELDGPQHFEQISNWRDPLETQEIDMYKMKQANLNGYTVIRILQEDVYYNRNEWQNNLKNTIRLYDKPECIFISSGKEYECYEING